MERKGRERNIHETCAQLPGAGETQRRRACSACPRGVYGKPSEEQAWGGEVEHTGRAVAHICIYRLSSKCFLVAFFKLDPYDNYYCLHFTDEETETEIK